MANTFDFAVTPYSVKTARLEVWFSAGTWCLDNIGEQGVMWQWHKDPGVFYFKNEKDATLFALRWS